MDSSGRCGAADLASARRIIFVRIQKVGTKSLSAVSLGLADAVSCAWHACRCQSYDATRFDAHALRRFWRPCAAAPCACDHGRAGALRVFWDDSPHMTWSDHAAAAFSKLGLRHEQVLWLTWLRSPTARVLSEYRHARATTLTAGARRVEWDYSVARGTNLSLLDFLSHPSFAVGASNRMVRMLGGGVAPLDGASGPAALALAKRRLASTAYFGLLERLRESLWLLRIAFPAAVLRGDAAAISPARRREYSSDGTGASFAANFGLPGVVGRDGEDSAMRKLLEVNALDAALYSYAEGLFAARLTEAAGCALH